MTHSSARGGMIGGTRTPTLASASGIWGINDVSYQLAGSAVAPSIIPNEIEWPTVPSDANFSSVSLLCHFDLMSMSGTTPQFTTTGTSGLTMQLGGTGVCCSAPNAKFGQYSVTMISAGAVLRTGDSSTLAFGTGDFTIEVWHNPNSVSTASNMIDFRAAAAAASPDIGITSGAKVYYFTSNATKITGTTNVTTGTWHHIALARSGTSTKLFLDGTQEGSTFTDSTNYIAGAGVTLGNSNATSIAIQPGFYQEFRITKGVARYTSNFTPPTTRFADY